MQQSYSYSSKFYASVDKRAAESADLVLVELLKFLNVDSIVDVGCGSGAWLKSGLKLGIKNAIGIDLPSSLSLIQTNSDFQGYLNDKSLTLIERDLVSDCITKFPSADVAFCLEVAEHLPSDVANSLIKLLTDSSNFVVFSAAQPGQGGTFHINERPLEHWIRQFAKCGFEAFDPFRKALGINPNVPRFYALNTLFFAKKNASVHYRILFNQIDFNHTKISENDEIDKRTLLEKIRYKVLSFLPVQLVTLISRLIKY